MSKNNFLLNKKINKTACVKFIEGCPRSLLDAVMLIDYLKSNGWKLEENIKSAQMIFLGVCGFDYAAERSSNIIIKTVLDKKDKFSSLILFGCLCDINSFIVKEHNDIIALKYKCFEKVDDIIDAKIKISESFEANLPFQYHDFLQIRFNKLESFKLKISQLVNNPIYYIMRFTKGMGPPHLRPIWKDDYFIKIGNGCTGHCSYCAIKSATGGLISYPIKKILRQFDDGLSKGYRVFRLLGEDVGGYGSDCDTNITYLLEKLFERNSDYQLVIEDFSPKWLVRYEDKIINLLLSNTNHIHHIVLPIQSGSKTILERMKRGYSIEKVIRAIEKLKSKNYGIKIATHIIIGFPGEGESEFKETIDVLKTLDFEHIEAHRYTRRPNTLSNSYKNNVKEYIKIKRLYRLRKEFPNTCRIRI